MELPISVDRKAVIAENTYLLTLDGDIDFQPSAVTLLIDLMKKNKNLGMDSKITFQFLQIYIFIQIKFQFRKVSTRVQIKVTVFL